MVVFAIVGGMLLPLFPARPIEDGTRRAHAERELVDLVRTVELRRGLERDTALLRRVEVLRTKLVARVRDRLRQVQA